MYHTIEFAEDFTVDLEISPRRWLERMRIRRGTRLRAQIKPYVVETQEGAVEVADLFFEEGTTTRMVPFESFSFVDQNGLTASKRSLRARLFSAPKSRHFRKH